jgi:hypothetical protein
MKNLFLGGDAARQELTKKDVCMYVLAVLHIVVKKISLVQLKQSLSLTEQHSMKMYDQVEIQFHVH